MSFARKINRKQARAAILAAARLQGCACDPDITLPPGGPQPAKVRVATVKHDDDCPLCWTSPFQRQDVARINAGEFDANDPER
jgi:hypothetical protein